MSGKRVFTTGLALIAALAVYAPMAAAELAPPGPAPAPVPTSVCSCMCTASSADAVWMCTIDPALPEPSPGCAASMQCDAPADPTTTGTDGPTDTGGTDVSQTDEVDKPGFDCKRRSIYRPDLGKYKKYNVCKRKSKMSDADQEKLAAYIARKEAKWKRLQQMWAEKEGRKSRRHGHRHHKGRHKGRHKGGD